MGEDQPVGMLGYTQNLMELSQQLGSAVTQGSEVLASGGVTLPAEMLAIDPDGAVTFAQRHGESYVAMDVLVGLDVVGVLRREHFFRRRQLIACTAFDIGCGDKVVLQTPNEERITTRKMRHDWGAAIRTQAARYVNGTR